MLLADALERDLEDLEAHLREREEILIAMDALAHVDLRDRVEARALERVDEQPGLDAVPGEERELLEQRATAALLAGERLHDARELREEEVEHRSRRELGHASAAGRLQLTARPDGPLVEGLDELDLRPLQERAEHAIHELRMRVRDVGVDPHHEIAARHVQALPERLAFAAISTAFGKDLVVDEDGDALAGRDLERGVVRATGSDVRTMIAARAAPRIAWPTGPSGSRAPSRPVAPNTMPSCSVSSSWMTSAGSPLRVTRRSMRSSRARSPSS